MKWNPPQPKSNVITDWWRPGKWKKCWVCGRRTVWAYLDLGYQHPDCDMAPTDEGNIRIVKGRMTPTEVI